MISNVDLMFEFDKSSNKQHFAKFIRVKNVISQHSIAIAFGYGSLINHHHIN